MIKSWLTFFKKRFQKRPFLTILSLAGILALAFIFCLYLSVTRGWIVNMPSKKELVEIQNYTASEIYSADGVLLGKYYIQDRTNVKYEQISVNMINALIATEDARFYQHKGIDKIGLLRVFFKSILLGDESAGGGSTLSQQLAKNLFPREKHAFLTMPINKLKEALIAQKLESIFSKKEILTLYLNTVAFGDNAYGVESASRRFFSKSSAELRIDEAAMLVGMLKANTTYNPRKNYDKALNRRNVVLDQMVKYKFLQQEEGERLKKLPIKLKYQSSTHSDGLAPYFREHLRLELDEWCKDQIKPNGDHYNLYTDGLKIYISIDSRMQRYAEESVAEHLSQLQVLFYKHWGKSAPWSKNYAIIRDAKRRTPKYQWLKKEGKTEAEINEEFKKKSKMTVFSWKGETEKNMSSLDSIRYYLWFLRAGLMALEPESGYVKAWVGGINHKYFKYDQVNTKAKRQAGSTFKPFVYSAALESGMNPCEYITNQRVVFENFNNWSPRNSDDKYGGMYSMAGALTNSVNTVSAQLIMKTGVNKVIDLAQAMGITSKLDPFPSLALGTADVSLYEMASAYGVFPNRGNYTKPRYLVKVVDSENRLLYSTGAPERKKAISTETAETMVAMLQNVVNEGTAAKLRWQYKLDFNIAGKTGTTQSHADGWFIGFTPGLVAGVWVGAEDRRIHFRSLELGQGSSMALPIWGKFFAKIAKDAKLRHYVASQFPAVSEATTVKLNCAPFIESRMEDPNLTFFEKLFGPKKEKSENTDNDPVNPKKKNPNQKEKSDKFKETFSKIRNMFKRKSY